MAKDREQQQEQPILRGAVTVADAMRQGTAESNRKATLRVEFAKSALIGLCNNPQVFRERTHEYFAQQVWAIADAMVATECYERKATA